MLGVIGWWRCDGVDRDADVQQIRSFGAWTGRDGLQLVAGAC